MKSFNIKFVTVELPEGYVLARETKSKKTQVAMQPSLFNEVKRIADSEGESFNEMLHILLRQGLAIYYQK